MKIERNVEEKNKTNHKWWHELFYVTTRKQAFRDGYYGPKLSPDFDKHESYCEKCGYQKTLRIIYLQD